MATDQRIPALAAQLIRSEHLTVIETVAAQLRLAIDEYVEAARGREPEAGAKPSTAVAPA